MNHTPIDFAEAPTREELREVSWDRQSAESSVSTLLLHAIDCDASDLFLSCEDGHIRIGMRRAGMIEDVVRMPFESGVKCINHLRNLCGMKVDEHRVPQDGRWIYRLENGGIIDLRLNSLPTLYGESLAVRLLPRDSHLMNLSELGFVGPQLSLVNSLVERPGGLILVTGPTGSGKTTTMYSFLNHLNSGTRKIHTVEDPVEYAMPGMHQTQVQENGAGTFARMMRGVLRQSPDVIMVGEIRDPATAETVVRAANSGQLVLATVHAPIAIKAVNTMLGLGAPLQALCSSLAAVLGQRLVRKLHPVHRTPLDLSAAPRTFDEVRPWLQEGQGDIVYAAAPDSNGQSGYIERTGIFEVVAINREIRGMILNMEPPTNIMNKALEFDMLDFRRAAMLKVAQGETSFDEMHRILPSPEDMAGDSFSRSI